MRSIGAIKDALTKIPGIEIVPPNPFPSRTLRQQLGIDPEKASQAQLNAIVEAKMRDPKTGAEFLNFLLKEEFSTYVGPDLARQKAVAIKGRDMFERAREVMLKQKNLWSPDIFSRLIDKIVEVWLKLGGEAGDKRDPKGGEPRRVIVERLGEDAAFHEWHCSRRTLSSALACFRRVLEKRQALVQDKVTKFYEAAWDWYQEADSEVRNHAAKKIGYWLHQSAISYQGWGDSVADITKIKGLTPAIFGTVSRDLPFLTAYPTPPMGDGWPATIPFLAAATDKFLSGLTVILDVTNKANETGELALQKALENTDKHKQTLCTRSIDTLQSLHDALSSIEVTQNKYKAQVMEKLTTVKQLWRCL